MSELQSLITVGDALRRIATGSRTLARVIGNEHKALFKAGGDVATLSLQSIATRKTKLIARIGQDIEVVRGARNLGLEVNDLRPFEQELDIFTAMRTGALDKARTTFPAGWEQNAYSGYVAGNIESVGTWADDLIRTRIAPQEFREIGRLDPSDVSAIAMYSRVQRHLDVARIGTNNFQGQYLRGDLLGEVLHWPTP